MSRIGKLPIVLPTGVSVNVDQNRVKLQGPKGTLEIAIPEELKVDHDKGQLIIEKDRKKEGLKPIHGTFRALLANAAIGVSAGWTKQLELVGTGYRAEVKGSHLYLTVGFSHPVEIKAPVDITFKVEKNIITVEGLDRDLVGRISARIRQVRPPEPYKGKGILYLGEIIRRKAGKAAKTVGTAA